MKKSRIAFGRLSISMMNRKRILIISNGFPFGGKEESFFGEEFQGLSSHYNISVMALGADPKEKIDEKYRRAGILFFPTLIPPINPFGMLSALVKKLVWAEMKTALQDGINLNLPRKLAAVLFYYDRSAKYLDAIKDIYRKEPFDLIYTLWCTPATTAAMRFSEKNAVPFVTRFHGGDLYIERVKAFGQYFPFRQLIASMAEKLIFLSETAKDYFMTHWSTAAEKCVISPLGTKCFEPLRLPEALNTVSIVTAANAIPLKRVELIIEALSLVDEKYRIVWNYFGDGPCLEKLKAAASERLNKSNIKWHFHGQVPSAKIPEFYKDANASVFMLLSSTEGVPVSIAEALGMGLPVIATDVGGIREEVIHKQTGFLLPANPAPDEAARAIEAYMELSDKEKLQMKENARALWQEKYSARENTERLICTFDKLFYSE